ncbi:MAG: alpha-amylase family glycosyl hydrolase [Chloroflexota bacterium]|nr:alpha-amylase family glycosyl hydrolase [Chloroflexota bacterium]
MTWWQPGVLYQIYPRSFADSNGDGVGDLDGITAHLDHLRGGPGSLGVDAIWISPFFRSPGADFGYDVSDYTDIDPVFGDLAAFDRLIAAAHERGLRVLLDLIPGHTSVEHAWFQAARSSRDDPHRKLYIWADPAPDGGPPNGWTATFGGSAWEWDEGSGQYYLHSFYPEQPDLNWREPEVHERMGDVIRFWLQRGVDGFRVDAIDRSMKDELLRENPPAAASPGRFDFFRGQYHLWNKDRPEALDVVRSIRRSAERVKPGSLLLGESYIPVERLARYLGDHPGDAFDLVFDFPFLSSDWEAGALRRAVEAAEAHFPPSGWPCRALSNHDNPRHGTRFGRRSLRAAAMLSLTLRGTPVLYMGEEIGMEDVPASPSQALDRAGRDAARTPMQWRNEPGAGFTSGEPWLRIGDSSRVNVADQADDPGSLFSLYRRLIAERAASPALASGTYRGLDMGPESGVFAYVREAAGGRSLVAIECAGRSGSHDLARAGRGRLPTSGLLRLSTEPHRSLEGRLDLTRLELAADEGVIITV